MNHTGTYHLLGAVSAIVLLVSGASSAIAASPAPSLSLLTPGASTTWIVGTPILVRWQSFGIPDSAQVAITLQNVDNYSYPVFIFTPAGYAADAYNTGSYAATVPNVIPGRYQVSVSIITGGPYLSATSATFAVTKQVGKGSIELISPKASTVWTGGAPASISWKTKNEPASAQVAITLQNVDDYSYPVFIFTPAGYEPYVTNTGSYAFTVPDVTPGRYQVGIGIVSGGQPATAASAVFTVK